MTKQFENLTEITDRKMYDAAMKYLNEVVDYATRNGYFADPEADNEYTREFGRVAGMTADYESIYMDLRPLKVKNPLIVSIEKEMRKNALNQRQAAELLEVKENTLSQILNGKRKPDVPFLKAVHEVLNVDGNLLLEKV